MFVYNCWCLSFQSVTQKSEKIGEEEGKCKHMAELAQHDLDEALPAMEEAMRVCTH
jgi:dynein heavy chain